MNNKYLIGALQLTVPIFEESCFVYPKINDHSQNVFKKSSDFELVEYEDILNESYLGLIYYEKRDPCNYSWVLPNTRLYSFVKKASRYGQITRETLDYEYNINAYKKYKFTYLKNINLSYIKKDSTVYPNLLLRSYEKNIIRAIYFFMRSGIILEVISNYVSLFYKKIDADIKSAFFYKLKQWMNLDLQKRYKNRASLVDELKLKHYIHAYLHLGEGSVKEDLREWKSFFMKRNDFDYNRKLLADHSQRRSLPLVLSTHFNLISLFLVIDSLKEFFESSKASNRELFNLKGHNSGYFSFLRDQMYCDIISLLKMIQVNESWINHIIDLNKKSLFDTKEFLSDWKIVDNALDIIKYQRNKRPRVLYNFVSIIKNISNVSFQHSTKYYHWILKNVEQNLISIFFTQAGRYVRYSMKEQPILNSSTEDYPMVLTSSNVSGSYVRLTFVDLMTNFVLGREQSLTETGRILVILKEIKTQIAYDHVRLVISIAKNLKYGNVETSDLLQEGMIGLIKAVERFQLDRGYQFSTYATWWVHQGLNRVISSQSGSMIPIPTHLQRKVHLIQSTSKELSKKLNREPLIEEIAKELRIPVYKIYQFLEAASLSKRLISLDQKVAIEDNRTFQYFLKSVSNRMPINTTRLFNYILQMIPNKDSTILKMRLGIIPYKRHTMEQVARIFSVNRDKIKIIEKNSLTEIKYNLSLHGRYEKIAPILSYHLSEKIMRD